MNLYFDQVFSSASLLNPPGVKNSVASNMPSVVEMFGYSDRYVITVTNNIYVAAGVGR